MPKKFLPQPYYRINYLHLFMQRADNHTQAEKVLNDTLIGKLSETLGKMLSADEIKLLHAGVEEYFRVQKAENKRATSREISNSLEDIKRKCAELHYQIATMHPEVEDALCRVKSDYSDGDSLRDISALEFYTLVIRELAERASTKNPVTKGRPDGFALPGLIRFLAGYYESVTGKKANPPSHNVTNDGDDKYYGAFFKFCWLVINPGIRDISEGGLATSIKRTLS